MKIREEKNSKKERVCNKIGKNCNGKRNNEEKGIGGYDNSDRNVNEKKRRREKQEKE